ncbi:MAG: hypothetical protein WB714_22295, partial [Candidatus Sulfotelmatobacter sp.]
LATRLSLLWRLVLALEHNSIQLPLFVCLPVVRQWLAFTAIRRPYGEPRIMMCARVFVYRVSWSRSK